MATLSATDRPIAELKADVLVLGIYAGKDGCGLVTGHGLPRAAASHLGKAIAALGLSGEIGSTATVPMVPGVTAGKVVLTGFGDGGPRTTAYEAEAVRRGVGAALRTTGKGIVAVAVPTDALLGAVAEGAALGAYAITGVRGTSKDSVCPSAIQLVVAGARTKAVKETVARAQTIGEAAAYCRDLVNLPPNLLYPQSFVESVRKTARGTGVRISVLDEKALEAGGFGGIVGVGMGSANPPRIAVMTYKPARAKAHIALVGKGVTFDSGGLCIKPAAGMLDMKSDMAGAGAVAAAVIAIAKLGLPVAVTGYLGLAENMPGSNAQRPSDVVTMRGGMTVEVLNTDAEGRMVLGDCIALASESTPDAIIDIATLTGAQVIALGNGVAACMSNDDGFRERVCGAASACGEQMWPMPLPEDLRKSLDSPVADIAHKGEQWGGMLTAGIFLSEFVGEARDGRIPWAHLDIAGPSFAKAAAGYTPKGGTGYGVRTLVSLVESYA